MRTVLVCGIPSEPPVALVCEALEKLDVQTVVFNQRDFALASLTFEFGTNHRQPAGWFEYDGRGYPLESICGVYVRMMDHSHLPEVAGEPPDSELRRTCVALHNALLQWIEIAPARVVNRMAEMASNSSKPYQAQLIRRLGFEIPETLITNDPDLVLAFHRQHGRIIYKSISGMRSIVQTFSDADLERLPAIRWQPTQFQAFVPGMDVRVHVVGDEVFATAIDSDATDYRYASRQTGTSAGLTAYTLPADVAQRCVQLGQALGLSFSGIDLKLTPDGRVFCFEVNPSPGFSYYESNTGQPIADAVARYLVGGG